MEANPEFNHSLPPPIETLSPTDWLKNDITDNVVNVIASLSEPDESWNESESDGLDPLFGDSNQFTAKRVLEFDGSGDGFGSEDDPNFVFENEKNKKLKKREGSIEVADVKEKKRRRKEKPSSVSISSRMKKNERKARLAQQADYQRVMRDMKGVGFKPVPLVEKSISSVLEKIRQRKLEVSKKWGFITEINEARDDAKEDQGVGEDLVNAAATIELTCEDKSESSDEQTDEKDQSKDDKGVAKDHSKDSPIKLASDDKSESSDDQIDKNALEDEITPSFRAPVIDTQDLLLDSEKIDSQGHVLSESSCPVEDIAPSALPRNLIVDSAFDDDISSNDEESDKENTDPHPKHLFGRSSDATGDPVKEFVDEEALEDDSDDDLLHCEDQDEEDNSEMEENCDYIATDVQEKPIDGEMRKKLHQEWDQQQDEAVTKKLLQKLKYGTKEREPSISGDEDAERAEEKDEVSDKDVPASHMPSSRATTKRLKQMIPHMFTDKYDGFVSSDDEETDKMFSKQCLLQKVEKEQQSKFLSSIADETSTEVLGRIKKLNVIPETKKKAKTSSIFEALLNKGSSSNFSKSSFLRRASSHPGTSGHRHKPSTIKSFIFGRDDSNCRSSMSMLEDSLDLGHKESQQKKNSSAKFSSSQAKWSTQRTENRSEATNGASLFDLLRSSSVEIVHDARGNAVDHEAVFAAFKSVKKQVKVERSYLGS